MSIKNRIEKLEAESETHEYRPILRITSKDGDSEETIERLMAEAREAWKRENPDKELPEPSRQNKGPRISCIHRVIVKPKPRSDDQRETVIH